MTARPATPSDYVWLYQNTDYMADGLKCAKEMMPDIIDRAPARFLDYGSGRGDLARYYNSRFRGIMHSWDPAIAKTELPPKYPVDWITCFDVLEHLTETTVIDALWQMHQIARKGLILAIANMSDVHQVDGAAVELHLIQQPAQWWLSLLEVWFPIHRITLRPFPYPERFGFVIEKITP